MLVCSAILFGGGDVVFRGVSSMDPLHLMLLDTILEQMKSLLHQEKCQRFRPGSTTRRYLCEHTVRTRAQQSEPSALTPPASTRLGSSEPRQELGLRPGAQHEWILSTHDGSHETVRDAHRGEE